MQTIIKYLKKVLSPVPLIAVLCLIFALMIWLFGDRIGMRGIYPFKSEGVKFWSLVVLLTTSGLLFAYLIISFVVRWRKARAELAKREPTELEKEQAAIDGIFAAAIRAIRENWTGKKRGMYGLPWYFVLGDHSAGKSTLIDNSDLRFPIDHEIRSAVSEFDGTEAARVAQWRVAGKEAVLFDINATFVSESETRSEVQDMLWQRFLRNVQKIRPRRPINGIILAIDVVDFLGMSTARRDTFAMDIRRTMNDIIEQLNTQMTIHIVFTKMDQIAGFSDYFENLNATEREQLFGFHFLFKGKSTPAWMDQLEKDFETFSADLQRELKTRVFDLKSPESRNEAFSFFRAMVGLKAPLLSFCEIALAPDRFTTEPLVRGVYFGSALQENAPKNVFFEAIGQRYALPAPLYGTSQAASFPFFIPAVLKEAVFPEAGLAGNNLKVEGLYRRRMIGVGLCGLLAVIGSSAYWYRQYNLNLDKAESVLAQSQSFDVQDVSEMDPTGVQYLPSLNQIRGTIFEFGDYREVGTVQSELSLYQGHRIGPIVDTAYKSMLHDRFAPTLLAGIEANLEGVCPKGGEQELSLLRVYRMMGVVGDTNGRDNRVISQYFSSLWQDRFEQNAGTQDALNNHMNYLLERVPQAYELDQNLVQQSQRNISRLAPYRRVYSSLRSQAERTLGAPVDMTASVGASFDVSYQAAASAAGNVNQSGNVLSGDENCGTVVDVAFARQPFEIPRLFTAEMYRDFFIEQNQQVARVVADDLWVLGQFDSAQFSDADYEVIQDAVREAYVDDYIGTWRQSLNALEVRPFEDLRDASEIVRAMSGPDMPIRRIAQLLRQNTVIYSDDAPTLEGDEAAQSALPVNKDRAAAVQIANAFRGIHFLLEDQVEGTATNADQIQAALVELSEYIKTIRDAPSPKAKALEMAIARTELVGEDPIYVLQRLAERAPAPFDAHLRHVADETWRVIMVAATDELNRKWHEEIYGSYQRLIAGSYPFDRSSDRDLPLADFEEFFSPGGVLDSFYRRDLLTFVEEATGEPKVIDGQSLAVDPGFAEQLKAAIEITDSYFNGAGDLYVEFDVSPGPMSPNLARAVLNFEGQLVSNSHGPARPIGIVWPNIIDGQASSRVDMSPLLGGGNGFGRQFNGPWSWLRLYDSAGKGGITNNSVQVIFTNAAGQEARFNIQPRASVNAFFNSPLSNFQLPRYLRGNES